MAAVIAHHAPGFGNPLNLAIDDFFMLPSLIAKANKLTKPMSARDWVEMEAGIG